MTDDRPPQLASELHRARPRRRPASRVATIKVTIASLAAAGVITAGLSAQMAAGHDPALGAGQKAKAGSSGGSSTQPQSSVPTTAPAPEPVVTGTS